MIKAGTCFDCAREVTPFCTVLDYCEIKSDIHSLLIRVNLFQ